MTEYVDIIMTDIQCHVTEPRKPQSVGRAIEKTIHSKIEHRAHTQDMSIDKDGKFTFTFHNPELTKLAEKVMAQGKKLRILIPSTGIPFLPGKDAVEFLKSKRWQEYMKKHPGGG